MLVKICHNYKINLCFDTKKCQADFCKLLPVSFLVTFIIYYFMTFRFISRYFRFIFFEGYANRLL